MGQKVSPHGLRLGVIKDWDSRWYADKRRFSDFLVEDHNIRKFLKKKLYSSGIAKIEIERGIFGIKIYIHCAKPGVVIGKSGSEIEKTKLEVTKLTKENVTINIVEVKQSNRNAQLIAENIALQLEKRISFRRAMKQAMKKALEDGVRGIKTQVSGRLGGAEIARSERYNEGNIPLQTLRADIEYGFAEAKTTYGIIGVKVWVYNGEVFKGAEEEKMASFEDKLNSNEDFKKPNNKPSGEMKNSVNAKKNQTP